ncbi:MAG: M24 family metallopeptidase [Planctomycetota bacterium]|jgi:Xaa-Pro aminopeptidase
MSTKRFLPILLALLLPAVAAADPTDSLTGTDMPTERRARRASVVAEIGEGTLLLFAAPAAGLRDYRQESNYRYLTGVDRPGGALLLRVTRPQASETSRAARRLADRLRDLSAEIGGLARSAGQKARAGTPGAREIVREAVELSRRLRASLGKVDDLEREGRGPAVVVERLYLPAASPARSRWEGPRLSPGPEATEATGIEETRDIARLFPDLRAELSEGDRLFLLSRADLAPRTEEAIETLRRDRPDLSVRDARRHLARVRSVKSPEEVARIRRACDHTCAGLREAMRSCRPGQHEFELQAVLEYACRRGGAPRQAFTSIVGSGPNGTVLHYRENTRLIEKGDLVLMDVGGEHLGYASDVTRTFPASGRFTKEQARIYDIVLRAQLAGIAAVRPGVTMGDVDQAARSVIRDAGYSRAFTHGTSHFVGLDVHDPGVGGPLRAGMVLTVEPGIYLAKEAIGIRVEDTVLVTEDGAEVLSTGAPKDRKAIESLMKGKGIGNLPIR